eukprot:10433351-Karenia_brevis.AAC.1
MPPIVGKALLHPNCSTLQPAWAELHWWHLQQHWRQAKKSAVAHVLVGNDLTPPIPMPRKDWNCR